MFYVILNEEVLPEPYETAAQAHQAGRRMARELEAETGRPATYLVAQLPRPH